MFLFIDWPALVCGWANFPIPWPHTPVQTKLECPLGPSFCLPPPGDIVISRRQQIFFFLRLSAFKFFPQLILQTIFFKFSKFPITRVGSQTIFCQMHLWGRQFISAIFLMQTIFFPIAIPLPRENNGLSLKK